MTQSKVDAIVLTIFTFMAIAAAIVSFEYKYKATVRYYPEMTRWEYFCLEEQVRIINHRQSPERGLESQNDG